MTEENSEKKKIVMIIAFRDFSDSEHFISREVLEKAGVEIKTASNRKGIAVGAEGGEANVDLLVSDINMTDFDVAIFIGGSGCLGSLDNEESYRVIREAVSQNKTLASICISPIILAKAGILGGKRATIWSSPLDRGPIKILEENGAIYQADSVVVDEKIITANGPSTSNKFGEAIIEVLKQ